MPGKTQIPIRKTKKLIRLNTGLINIYQTCFFCYNSSILFIAYNADVIDVFAISKICAVTPT